MLPAPVTQEESERYWQRKPAVHDRDLRDSPSVFPAAPPCFRGVASAGEKNSSPGLCSKRRSLSLPSSRLFRRNGETRCLRCQGSRQQDFLATIAKDIGRHPAKTHGALTRVGQEPSIPPGGSRSTVWLGHPGAHSGLQKDRVWMDTPCNVSPA